MELRLFRSSKFTSTRCGWSENLRYHIFCSTAETMSKKRYLTRIVIVAGSILLMLTLLLFYHLCMRPNILVKKSGRQLSIPRNTSFLELKKTLQQQEYVANLASFSLLARLMRYDQKIMPGAYQLTTDMSNWEVIRTLRTGMQQPVKVILHHVRTKEELAAKITQNIDINAIDFKKLLDAPSFVGRYGFNTDNVMTMFIPNTYEVYWTITPEGLFERMYKEYQKFWNVIRCGKAKRLNLTPIEISILASIVQSETNKIEEAPLIAGVYINRLRRKMPIQSCPTLLYALGDNSIRRVLRKYQGLDSPYNTYKYRGLPPGPINLPAVAMIDAVLNSKSSSYLYFVAKEDFSGYHHFSRSFEEHLHNARRYQKALNQTRIYR